MSKKLVRVLVVFLGVMTRVWADQPKPWQIGFQTAASPQMENITAVHDLLLWIIAAVAIVVTALMTFVVLRFRESRNKKPSKVSHNTLLEIIWTAIPVLILIAIGVPSIKILFLNDKIEKADLTIKAIGHQWYWSYEYPDLGINFDSYLIEDKDLKPGQLRLLEVDNRVIVPVGKTVRVLVTAVDVLHSFAVPAFGIKKDAVPGFLTETWFRVSKEGVYYGQCSELCGVKHGYMPIAVEVVSQDKYDSWVKSKEGTHKPEVAMKVAAQGLRQAAKSKAHEGAKSIAADKKRTEAVKKAAASKSEADTTTSTSADGKKTQASKHEHA